MNIFKMNSNNKIITAVIVVTIVVGIAYVLYAQPQSTQAPDTATNQPAATNESATSAGNESR